MRKNQPFVEVLNLEKEYKEYIKLCKSSSKKYKYYDDWKNYLISRFKILPKAHINNFKHFLMFYSFLEHHSSKIFLSVVLAAVPLVISTIYSNNPIFNTIATVISVLVAAVLVMVSYLDFARRDKFVNDVLGVFEEFEKKIEDEKGDKTEVIL
ncbi:MAG: hypothetical protein ACI4JM_11760 [Oscillospiraceae bacterium]